MSRHRYVELIETYYRGCNTHNYELMISTFTDDVVHYFVDHGPVIGAHELTNYWCKVAPKTSATWEVDHAIVQEPEAVIEWSMAWTPPATGKEELLRGAEWYVFRGDLITEIRSYHNNYYLADAKNSELWDFDYSSRGYRLLD